MEAGTNAFSDHSFTTDDDPSRSNSTANTQHRVSQLQSAGLSWMVYMEGIDGSSGACPLNSNGNFAAWHNPVIWFQDVSGSPPSTNNAYCSAHHRNYGQRFTDDLNSAQVANFNFITPDLCDDMHETPQCPNQNGVNAGDTWLSQNLPPIIDFVNAHGGVIFIIWDETSATNQWGDPIMPFLAIGPNIKQGYASPAVESHSSYLKTVEELLGVPVLSNVQGANDLSGYFKPGTFPADPPAQP
jgi:phosphatidylinositol-3-phosphatase